jgi:hypothetical protein
MKYPINIYYKQNVYLKTCFRKHKVKQNKKSNSQRSAGLEVRKHTSWLMLRNSCFFMQPVTVHPFLPSAFQCVRHFLCGYVSRSQAYCVRERLETRWERCPGSFQNSRKKKKKGLRRPTSYSYLVLGRVQVLLAIRLQNLNEAPVP